MVMSPKDFEEKMQELADREFDEETRHVAMDELMCKVLIQLGYDKGVDIFDHTEKWYS